MTAIKHGFMLPLDVPMKLSRTDQSYKAIYARRLQL